LPLIAIVGTVEGYDVICCYDELLAAETGWTP
jgi:hypothetical protein